MSSWVGLKVDCTKTAAFQAFRVWQMQCQAIESCFNCVAPAFIADTLQDDAKSEELKSAASVALGGLTTGALEAYLPTLLQAASAQVTVFTLHFAEQSSFGVEQPLPQQPLSHPSSMLHPFLHTCYYAVLLDLQMVVFEQSARHLRAKTHVCMAFT